MAEIGTTSSKYSKAVTNGATMDTGQLVEYDPANGSYNEGTSPAITKDYGKKNDKDLTNGFKPQTRSEEMQPV